jgi:hypothetical protein
MDMKARIQQMIDDGFSFKEIQQEVQCSFSYIYRCNQKPIKPIIRRKIYDPEIILMWQEDYDSGLSLRDIVKKYKISKMIAQTYIKTRNYKEAAAIKGPTGYCSPDWHSRPEAKIASRKGGGYRENAGRSKKFRVLDSNGKETVLQSTYELMCSEILNECSISWIRPKALMYSGKRYFADFYLVDYDIYLDPKNNYKAKLDQLKITEVQKQNNVSVFVLLKEQITKEYILSLIDKT